MADADDTTRRPSSEHDQDIPPSPMDETPDRDETTSTTTGATSSSSSAEPPKRVPSLRSVSDPRSQNANSTARGLLDEARNPARPALRPSGATTSAPAPLAGRLNSLDPDVLAKARRLQQDRMKMAAGPAAAASSSPTTPAMSPMSPMSPMGGGPANGGFLPRMPANLARPGPGVHNKSAPAGTRLSLMDRRGAGLKLSDMGAGGAGMPPSPAPSMRRAGAPKLSDMGTPSASSNGSGGGDASASSSSAGGSKLDDFKKYIDAEKGWITFDGAATITKDGVNFANGQTFKISLDEIETIGELGKGNYGTVYKVRHTKRKVPRFGQGLSGFKAHQAPQDSGEPVSDPNEGTTGMLMGMKEIRLELDDAKFTTILKELVILHECVSPYIIDFYGAFYQEGAVYMCIEYMDGGSVDKLYAGGVPESVLRKITNATVMGLKSLKDDHNIIHRDVKPTNILVNTRGQIKICDFGVSGNLVASIAKTNIGCQSYMAPERISGGGMAQTGNADGTYSVQSDVWSLGLTIIECAMGRYPYPPEVSSTIFGQLNAIVEGEPPKLPEEGYSDMAKDFVSGCTRKIPKMRPTYAALLKHPWLSSLSKPVTIAEEAEEGEEAEQVAEKVGRMALSSGTDDEEVAGWVRGVLADKASGKGRAGAGRPALHAAPLDTVSPLNSPALGD